MRIPPPDILPTATDRKFFNHNISSSVNSATLPRRQIVIAFFVLVILMAVMRLYTWDEPLERDITSQALVGNEYLAGKTLYKEIWSDRAPLIHWTYSMGQLAVGFGLQQIYFLWLVFSVITLFGVYACVSSGSMGSRTGVWAAAFWALVSCDMFLQANQPNTEVFMNSCMIWALALLLRDGGEGRGIARGIGIGLLFGLASLYKTHALFMAVGLAGVHVLMPAGGPENRKRALVQIACGLTTGSILWIGAIGYIWWTGAIVEFWENFYIYMSHYVGSPSANVLKGMHPQYFLSQHLYGVFPLIVAAIFALALINFRRLERENSLLLVYGVLVAVMVALPGKFFPHYYQFWIPWLAIMAAKGLTMIQERVRKEFPDTLKALGIAIVVLLLLVQARFFSMSPDEWSRQKYGPVYSDVKRIAEMIRPLLEPEETLFNWGGETGFYFYAKSRLSAAKAWWFIPLVDGPTAPKIRQRMFDELASNPPQLLVVSPHYKRWPIPERLVNHYVSFKDNKIFSPFKLYYLRGGALESRIMKMANPSLPTPTRRQRDAGPNRS